jgi:hypothetical protein
MKRATPGENERGKRMHFKVALTGNVFVVDLDGNPVADDEHVIEAHLDQVMDELLDLDAQDPSIDLDRAASNEVAFSVLVEAVNPLDAVNEASGLLRTAIHAASGATPDWPGPSDKEWAVTLVSVSTELIPVSDDEELVGAH